MVENERLVVEMKVMESELHHLHFLQLLNRKNYEHKQIYIAPHSFSTTGISFITMSLVKRENIDQ